VNFNLSLVVSITITYYCRAPSASDHFIHMWRHLQTADSHNWSKIMSREQCL